MNEIGQVVFNDLSGKEKGEFDSMDSLLSALKNEVVGIKEASNRLFALRSRLYYNDPSKTLSEVQNPVLEKNMGHLEVLKAQISEIIKLNSEIHATLNNLEKVI